jgi:hypothetical protein
MHASTNFCSKTTQQKSSPRKARSRATPEKRPRKRP